VRTVYRSSLCTGPHFKRSLPTAGAHFVHWEYIYIYIDDILIHAKSKKEHDEILEKVFVIAQKNNVKFNLNKCKFGLK
jgi:hypothetical protein